MRNPFGRVVKRDTARPSLKERAALLKATAARLMRHKTDEAGTDQSRRMMVAGSVATMVAAPLPVLAKAVLPAAVGPHPDQALFDAEAGYLRAVEAEKAASVANTEAQAAFWKALGPCPDSLFVRGRLHGLITWPGQPLWNRGVRLQWVRTDALSDDGWDNAWTVKGLEHAIALAPQALGRGGRTPHLIREWRALLPIAAAYEARRSALEARFNTKEMSRSEREACTARNTATMLLSDMPASTLEGLAVKARLVDRCDWHKMPSGWVSLLQSAAVVSGVALREPDYDPAAWVKAWEAVGGTIKRHPVSREVMFCAPPGSAPSAEARAEVGRLQAEFGANDAVINRWVRDQA